MKKILSNIMFALIGVMFVSLLSLSPKPVVVTEEELLNKKKSIVECIIRSLGYNQKDISKLAYIIVKASDYYHVDPVLITCLMYTESGFQSKVVSKKGYKGLLQTPVITEYDEINIMYGISIFKDKLKQADNNLEKALYMYKGNKKPADVQAKQVIKIYTTAKNIFGGRLDG